ncbi:MAG: two-component sensor histidine kinase [Anaerolineae bacterium]|nr:histidine kinase [Anaerolineales bacterium]MCQ3977783.1 two-component sensor histidine kinase [Anaerolineae bacterium]
MSIELAASEPLPKYMGKFIDFFAGIHLSLRRKILLSFFIVIFLMAAINAVLILEVLRFNRQYDVIITNITTANSINGYIKPAIDTEMWNIVAGKKEFKEGSQYQIIEQVDAQITSMMANTESDKSRIKLEVILRTMDTLSRYVDKMGTQISQGSRVADNEQVLENIRGVSEVVEESVQDYVLFEVNQAEQQYKQTQTRFTRWAITYMILLPCVIAFSIMAAWIISASIYIPIKKLHDVTTTITKNDLQALMTRDNIDEITELGLSFNIMIGRIRELLAAKIKEQEQLKKAELRALQAQINPHFLYNTLDTIIWLAEANKTAQVIEIVGALSSFFRIALSKGHDWITIHQEIEHVRSYLTIQKMRYRDILDYKLEVDEDILDGVILKLTLQPLVENALYHGIKNKRNGGTITVRARRADQNLVLLEVQDDGVGFTSYKLAQIQQEINNDSEEITLKESGFGLENVNKRIKLFYGKEYGLSIDSHYLEGTRVTVTIPLKNGLNSPKEEG